MLLSYDPKRVKLSVAGRTIDGFGDGTKITVSRTGNVTTTQTGVDGDKSVSYNNDYGGTLSFTLMHNAPLNSFMYALVKSYEIGETFFFPVVMNDPSGASVTTVGWIESQPSYDVGNETGSLEWTLGIEDARLFPTPEFSIANAIEGAVKSIINAF